MNSKPLSHSVFQVVLTPVSPFFTLHGWLIFIIRLLQRRALFAPAVLKSVKFSPTSLLENILELKMSPGSDKPLEFLPF